MVTATTEPVLSKTPEANTTFYSKPLSWEDAWRDWEKEKSEVQVKPSPAVTPTRVA
jgi:hypothetical protein